MISIIPIISASSTEVMGSTTQLLTDLWPLLALVIGIPFAFFVIERIIDIASPETKYRGQYLEKMENGGWRTGFDFSDEE